MAYQTGTFTNADDFEDVKDLLQTFAVANGWTANNSTYPYLNLTKGACSANFFFDQSPTIDDNQGPTASATSPDFTVRSRLGKTYGGTGSGAVRFNSQPSAVNNANRMNDMTPTYDRYWLFASGTTGPQYIHLVIRKTSGRFCHLSFGEIDKKGMAYTGGAFLTSMYWQWGFSRSDISGFISSNAFSDQGSSPFAGDHQIPFNSYGQRGDSSSNVQLRLADGDDFEIAVDDLFNPHDDIVPLFSRSGGLPGSLNNCNVDNSSWLGWVFHVGPNPVNNTTAMFEQPVMLYDNDGNQRVYQYGTIPGQRLCSMKGRTEAEQISFASENWIVFPWKRSTAWFPEPFISKQCCSGPFAYAYKIIP